MHAFVRISLPGLRAEVREVAAHRQTGSGSDLPLLWEFPHPAGYLPFRYAQRISRRQQGRDQLRARRRRLKTVRTEPLALTVS